MRHFITKTFSCCFSRAARRAGALSLAALLALSVQAGGSEIAPDCAARDLDAVMWIEEQGRTQALPSDALAAAAFTMIDARNLCRGGDVTAALALYDRIGAAPTSFAHAPGEQRVK